MNRIPRRLLVPGFNSIAKLDRAYRRNNFCYTGRRFLSSEALKVRNVAIIAHVDHGKTTLMDKLLQTCGMTVSEERAMDSNDQEKERGITITSKYTRLYYKDHALHVVDTPGHADFGGEVERILNMVDGVILLVDASEGPMSQTKFVLSRALAAKKPAIVVLNKVDREGHRVDEVESEILDLFCALTSDESLLDYPLMYASAKQGWVTTDISDIPGKDGVLPLLDTILSRIPSPHVNTSADEPFALGVNTIHTDPYLGRVVTGKVEAGRINVGDKVKVLNYDGDLIQNDMKVTKLFYLEGLQRVDVDSATAGDIVSLAGTDGGVADTIAGMDRENALATIPLSPPVLSMTFAPNNSPLNGKDGTKFTSAMIKERLQKEIENNVTISLRPSADPESIDVQGRGELQIGILVETMRREGFELTICPPQVLGIVEKSADGKTEEKKEPIEEVTIDVAPEMQGMVMDAMNDRKGTLLEFKDIGDRTRLVFEVPSRGMMGFRSEIISATRGSATVNSTFSRYGAVNATEFSGLKKGKLVSMENGKTTGYALSMVEERGQLFVGIGEEVYEGMVVGENAKTGDLDVNPCRMKKLTNVRSTGAEEKVNLVPPRRLTVEETIAYMDEDEVLEVTPKNLRLRKRILDSGARHRYNKAKKPQLK